MLERVGRPSLEHTCVEDGVILLFVVYLEERNDRSCEDIERTAGELKSFFFKTLYHWTAALDLICLAFIIFLTCSLFLTKCFSCILLMYLSCLCSFNNISFTYKKKFSSPCSEGRFLFKLKFTNNTQIKQPKNHPFKQLKA
jgi:hypothetical protein